MKLTCVIILMALMQVSAATFGQNLTLKKDNISISKIFFEIRKQTGYDVLVKSDRLNTAKKIDVAFENVPVTKVLDQLLKGTELQYSFDNKIISITLNEKSFLDRLVERWQNIDVTGRILDENGKPLVGASIKVKDNSQSTTSDVDGRFTLRNVSEDAVLQISFIGYKTREVRAVRNIGELKLEIGSSELEEVTISTGYFETTKTRSTMNISKVDGKEIQDQPVSSLMNAIVGRVPGIDITPPNGLPGRAPSIQIRGNNSLSQLGSAPLYVIDGVQIESRPLSDPYGSTFGGYDPLATISPANIESIEVLKDAAATAIYGSRGANGVIRITTKRAQGLETSTNFNLNVYSGVGKIVSKVNLLNREQYLSMRQEAFRNVNREPSQFDYDLNGVWDSSRNTDWQDLLLGGTANTTDVQASFTGGNEQTSFRLGGGYHKETPVYAFSDGFGWHRASADFSFRHTSINKKLEVIAGLNFGNNKDKTFGNSFASVALTLPPVAPNLYDGNGGLNWQVRIDDPTQNTWINPLAETLNRNDISSTSIISSATISYKLLKGLQLKALGSLSQINNEEIRTRPLAALEPSIRSYYTGTMNFVNSDRRSFMLEPSMLFSRNSGKHHYNATLGLTYQQSRDIFKSVEGSGYTSDALLGSIRTAPTTSNLADDNNEYKYISAYMHIGYDFAGKYLFDATARRDGSSRFGPGKRFGNFGAIGLGWVFSNEIGIKKNATFLSFGKIRGSYGITGNDQINNYQYLDTYNVLRQGYQGGVSLAPRQLFNSQYAWEETKKLELGLELGFFKNRILIETSWYQNISSNQLIDYPLSEATGFQSVKQNFNATVQNTGLEVMATVRNVAKDNFKWTTSFNVTVPRNKLVKFDGIESSPYSAMYKVGEPLSIQNVYTYKGVDPKTGLFLIEDVDGNKIYNNLDTRFSSALGRTQYYGINNTFVWRQLEFSMLLQVSDNMVSGFMFPSQAGSLSNQPVEVLNRWQQEDDKAQYQKFHPDFDINYLWLNASDQNFKNIFFIRCKTLSLSYLLQKSILERVKMKSARIYLQGQNIFTITKFNGYDPESGNTVPPLRFISLGLQLAL